jgi:ComF family protein
VTTWLRFVLDAIFPASCGACDAPLPLASPLVLCASCRATMSTPPPPLCAVCGLSLGTEGDRCTRCRVCAPAFTTARAAALYLSGEDGLNPLATAVRRLKYDGRRALARALGELLAERYPYAGPALLVPVPLHPRRLRSRGFNQALLLARVLGRRRGLPVAARALRRIRATPAQAGLPAAARKDNLERAFVVAAPVDGARVVLVDDILTTGATADACACALLDGGAARVDVYTVGRAP